MDALTKKAIESLIQEVLPKLGSSLKKLESGQSELSPQELDYFFNEAIELLQIAKKWNASQLVSTPEQDDDLSDEDKMLAEMEAESTEGNEISDDEAQRLLAEMEAPATAAASEEKDMSDDEAQRLLAEMEAPATAEAVQEEDETAALLAQMEGEDSSGEEDEALSLLKSMEADDAQDINPIVPVVSNTANNSSEAHDPDEDYEEVPEWEENDFRSDPDMMNDFLNNADELLETLDETILKLEASPDDREIIEEIFRAAHTLKGAAGMFGFKGIEALMHKLENLFDLIRKGKLTASSEIVDLVFKGLDTLKSLVEAIKNDRPSGTPLKPLIVALVRASKGKSVAVEAQSQIDEANPTSSSQFEEPVAEINAEAPQEQPKKAAPKKAAKKIDSTIRVDLERLDVLVNLVGELVTDRTRFMSIEDTLRAKYSHLQLTADMTETVQLFGRHMNEIQDIIMKVRMVPIGNAFNKFPRVVRDLARQLDKQIDLMIDGETTELDKTLVEQIGDPLIHLIRNACDHGIETPEARRAKGKDEVGHVFLSACQEGNNIIITIEDDGKGMDAEIIRQKGIEKGLITEDKQLEDSEIFNLIFEPGFSTAEKVTNVSGRGVGMDVVKKQITRLKGGISIDSTLGEGSTITITLPLTLAIVQSLLVQSQNETYAIPHSSIVESIRISPHDIQKVGDMEVVKRMDKVLPLIHLNKTLSLEKKKDSYWYHNPLNENKSAPLNELSRKSGKSDRLFVVVVGSGDKRFGIVVDSLLNQQEMVIKSMGSMLKSIPCVAGGAVLGSGEVVLVLDIHQLEDFFRNNQRNANLTLAA